MSAYQKFKQALAEEIHRLGRDPKDVHLIAVSKYLEIAAIQNLFSEGQRDFAENYLQDALPKIQALANLPIRWHGIGHIQSNKVKKFSETFSVLHSVDRLKLLEHLDAMAQERGNKISVFLQVNIAQETSKSGFSKDRLFQEFEKIIALKHLKILGLMTMAPHFENPENSRPVFSALRILQDTLNAQFKANLSLLSMGMSSDWKQALAEGANYLRIGHALWAPLKIPFLL
jgi:pyridoxal phosphate enzyme (YggS family)